MKGAFAAGFLAKAEALAGRPIADCFDLVVGTSTGGIIALGVSMGIPAGDIESFYSADGPTIFPRPLSLWDPRSWPIGCPVHSGRPLNDALKRVFGNRLLGHAKIMTLVPALRAGCGSLHVFKTPHDPKFFNDQHMEVVAVARATSAAPLYLPPYKAPDGTVYLDGGLVANNPAALGVAEAIGVLGVPRESIKVLSIASPAEPFELPKRCRHEAMGGFGPRGWNLKSVSSVYAAGQDALLAGLSTFLFHKESVYRIEKVAPNGAFQMDNPAHASELAAQGSRQCVFHWEKIRPGFFAERVEGRAWPLAAGAA